MAAKKKIQVPKVELTEKQTDLLMKILLLAIGAIIVYFILDKLFFADKRKEEKEEKKHEKSIEKETTKDKSTKATIGDGQAAAIADLQNSAMDGGGTSFGTDEKTLFNSLKGLNGKDLQKVFNAFGKRRYFLTGSSGVLGSKINLFSWYANELNTSDMVKMSKIWAKSGLTFPTPNSFD